MKKRIVLCVVVAFSFLALCAILKFEKYAEGRKERPTLGVAAENIGSIGDYWVTVPGEENRGLAYDVSGVQFEDDETIYLILPKDVDGSHLVYYIRDGYDNYVSRIVSDFDAGEVIVGSKKIELVKSELPVMFIEADDFSEFLNTSDREMRCYGDMQLSVPKKAAEENLWAEEIITKNRDDNTPRSMYLKARGNGAWAGPHKKPFSLFLERSEDLLGMGKSKKWNLLADVQDKTLLRNKVFFRLARNIGMDFVPMAEHITLYVNGSYQGVYEMTTKISVDKNRINLSEGDFLINWGAPNTEQPISYESTTWFADGYDRQPYVELEWPKECAEIEEKQKIIQRFISSIEDTTSDEYLKYMDMDSMVKYYWVQEAGMNYDAAFRSAYSYYKESTGKIYMGPIWDMDLTLGISIPKQGVSFQEPEGWKVRNLSWYAPLFQHEEFKQAVRKAYFEDGVREELFALADVFEQVKSSLLVDGEMNFRYWKGDDKLIEYPVTYSDDTYEGQVDRVIDFYKKRINWIDEQMKKE